MLAYSTGHMGAFIVAHIGSLIHCYFPADIFIDLVDQVSYSAYIELELHVPN
jgi:hypothetical protein